MRRLMTEDEISELVKKINSEFGSDFNHSDFKFFIKDEKKKGKKIFIYSGGELPQIPIEWIGLHFGTIQEDGFIPSIEGAQIIGKTATMKILEVSKKETLDIMSGFDICLTEEKPTGCYILKFGEDIPGVGKISGKMIMNIIPKSRRISGQFRFA